MNEHISLLNGIIFALMIFSFTGWYFAENDNEILRQELSTYTGTEVRK